jgi:hypothetical protein
MQSPSITTLPGRIPLDYSLGESKIGVGYPSRYFRVTHQMDIEVRMSLMKLLKGGGDTRAMTTFSWLELVSTKV